MSDSEYLKWASQELARLVENEEARRQQLETKAIWSVTGVVALGALSVNGLGVKLSSTSFEWWLLLITGLVTLRCIAETWQSLRIIKYAEIEHRQYASAQVMQCDEESRLESLCMHLTKVLDDLHVELGLKAGRVRKVQESALFAAIGFLLLLALSKL